MASVAFRAWSWPCRWRCLRCSPAAASRIFPTPKRRSSPRCRWPACRRCRPITTNRCRRFAGCGSARRDAVLRPPAQPQRRGRLRHLPQDRPAVPGRPAARRRDRDQQPPHHAARRRRLEPWFFWDGRRDSLWAQALTPLEDPVEHAGNRTAYARFMAKNFHERYERIFGPLPPLDGLPDNASPLGTAAEKAAWAAMSEDQRNAVNSVFANIGKAIAAFERSLTPPETRFDRFAEALAAGTQPAAADDLTGEERAGLKLFIGKAQLLALPQRPALHRRPFPQYRRAVGARPARGSRPRDRRREGRGRSVQLPRPVPRRQRCGLRRVALHGQGRARAAPRLQDAVAARRRRPAALHACRPDRHARGGGRPRCPRAGERGRALRAQPADLVGARAQGAGRVPEDARSAGLRSDRYLSFTVSIATKVEVCATCGSAEMRSPSTRR